MNILFISNDPALFIETSPVRERMRRYAAEVAKGGGELHILSRAGKHFEITEGPLHLHGSRIPKLLVLWRLSKLAKEIVRTHSIDIVSAQDPFELGLAASWVVRGTTAKLHLQVHTDYLSPWFTRGAIYRSPQVRMPFLNRIRVYIAKRVVPQANGIRVVSQRIKDSMLAQYGKAISEPSVIPIAVSAEVPTPVPLPDSNFSFTLISVGRLEPEKRVQDCIAVLARLRKGYPRLGLVVVGDGRERRRLARYARKLGVADRVQFLGWRTDAWGIMQGAQCFIQASAYEGYGISLLEAALAGVPIVTTDVGIVGEVFVGYEQVFAAPPGDPSNLAALTARLIEDHYARTLLAIEAKRVAQAHLASVKNSPTDMIADIMRAALPRT